ncbi:MAG: DUF4097 family beta strand repeat protein [Clostridia bacterium]|nr:DUF4097 family beta strand repeat protein [Clostridia bacterium]
MKTWQKVVKYIAILLAIFLCVGVISGICTAILSLSLISSGNRAADTDYTVYKIDNSIEILEIEVSAGELIIKTDDEFRVESNNNFLTVRERGNRLIIKEQTRWLSNNKDIVIELYIPEETVFEKAEIEAGSGRVRIDQLIADDISIDFGSGDANIDYLVADNRISIEHGAGKLSIDEANLNNFNMDMGAGNVDITAALTGKNKIEQAVGSLDLILIGKADDYCIEIDKGVGIATISDEIAENEKLYGNGDNELDIDGGIGNTVIEFTETE